MPNVPITPPSVNDPTRRNDLLTLDALAAALAELLAALPASPDVERAQTLARLLETEAARQLAAVETASAS